MGQRTERRGQRALLERSTLLDELDAPPLARAAGLFGLAVVLSFVAWASFAVVEETAQAPGAMGRAEEDARLQHPTGGRVAAVFAREGMSVAKGETILVLDQVDTRAALEQSRSQRLSLVAQRVRLSALISGGRPDFAAAGLRGTVIAADQERLYRTELEEKAAQEDILSRQEEQVRLEIGSLGRRREEAERQLALVKEERAIKLGLAERGIVARTEIIAIEREVAALEGEIGRLPAESRAAEERLGEIAARRLEYAAASLRAWSDDLASVNDRLAQLDETGRRLEHGALSLDVVSPIDGLVHGLAVSAPGEVIGAGETIATIVPRDRSRHAEIRLSPRDIGSVRPGMPVRLKVSAWPFDRYGGWRGRLEDISPTTFDSSGYQPYYRAGVLVEGREIAGGEDLPLIPGMTLTAEIITGERTIMQYLLKPIFASAREAFHER